MKFEYDLVVIGGGAAGLTAAGMGANFGAKTMMVEADRLGGDCTWHGCVPSKSLLHAAKLAQATREAEQFGLQVDGKMDFQSIMEHVRQTRQEVYEDADNPEIFRDMGVEVVFGRASFEDNHAITIESESGTRKVSSRYFVIATGSRAVVPPIEGLQQVPYLTNETLFELDEQPGSLAVIGGGPIGIEMAQAFQRLGTQVTVLDMQPRILSNDDAELAGMLLERLKKEGIRFEFSSRISRVGKSASGAIEIHGEQDGEAQQWTADALLVATGRRPNFEALEPENAGLSYGRQGITVDDRCRTNVKHIYAAGDVTGRYQFTHMSEHMAKVSVTNALLKLPMKMDTDHVTWSTFTDPELAHVGATEEQLQNRGVSYKEYRFPYSKIDRAITDGDTDGLIKIFAKKMTGTILGATIYGKQAGDMISEYALAMSNGVSLRDIADTIHPYPTYGLGVRRAADQWYVQNQSEWMIKLIQKLFGYRGSIPDLSDEDRII